MTVPDEAAELSELSVATLAGRLRTGDVSAVQVAEHFLRRIDALDDQIQAWVTVDGDRVLNTARVLDSQVAASGRGPLHGVPIGIKDLFATKGLRTTMGSRVFANHVPDADAVAVERLTSAGALVIGKTVTTEFATLDPPPTRNPWNHEHSPGGSSSGSAAAVAARMCPAATGTQTVGSLGRPAAYCGLVGILPTAARVSLNGVFPVAWSLDHAGVFARSVEDAGLVLNSMCDDPIPLSDRQTQPRVGVVGEFFHEVTEESAWAHHARFIDDLGRRGVDVVELDLPPVFNFGLPAIWTIMRSELASVHQHLHPAHKDAYGPTIRGLVESGQLLEATDYLCARRIRRAFQRDMMRLFSSCDVILSPGAPGPAPAGLASTGSPLLQAPWTLADFPTVSLPLNLTSDGLPIGIQLTALPFGEEKLFEASRWMESFIGFSAAPRGI